MKALMSRKKLRKFLRRTRKRNVGAAKKFLGRRMTTAEHKELVRALKEAVKPLYEV
jgi:hypothetical protein